MGAGQGAGASLAPYDIAVPILRLALLSPHRYNAASENGSPSRREGMLWRPWMHHPTVKGCKMPKLKTKSGVKKRFKITASGKIKSGQTGKRHGMIKRSNRQIRNLRGTAVLSEPDTKIIKKFMPYARGQ